MSNTDALLVYGIQLRDGLDLEYDEDSDEEAGPRWLGYMGTAEAGVRIAKHCSDSCPMYLLCADGCVVYRAARGYPVKIAAMGVPFDARQRIMDYVTKHNLPTEGDIGWWLCSLWGV